MNLLFTLLALAALLIGLPWLLTAACICYAQYKLSKAPKVVNTAPAAAPIVVLPVTAAPTDKPRPEHDDMDDVTPEQIEAALARIEAKRATGNITFEVE